MEKEKNGNESVSMPKKLIEKMRDIFNEWLRGTPITKKKFIINNSKKEFKEKKKFDITTHQFPIDINGQHINWEQQNDDDSCGYCLLNNAISLMEDIPFEKNASDIFSEIDKKRTNTGNNRDGRKWLSDIEFKSYLTDRGYDCFSTYNKDDNRIEEMISSNNFSVFVTMFGDHYTGVIPGSTRNYYLLNSELDGPQPIDFESALSIAKLGIGKNSRGSDIATMFFTKKKKFQIYK